MKSVIRDFTSAFLWGFALPAFLLNLAVLYFSGEPDREPVPEKQLTRSSAIRSQVLRRQEEGLVSSDLEEYLVGVVLAEMPVSFPEEALKAQAVAARTYAARAMATGGKHEDGSLCTDSACCQAYISPEDYLHRGGSTEGLRKAEAAVAATSALVLTYEGELIEATYYSCSGGMTEAAVEVWGTDYPYLQAVESPGEENAAVYRNTVSICAEDFSEAIGFRPEGEPEIWIEEADYTAAGSVRRMRIGGRDFSGTELRALLGLRSAAFTVAVTGDTLHITTRGYGHRVGMSQYGAQAMASRGSDYTRILAHYYPGTELSRMETADSGRKDRQVPEE